MLRGGAGALRRRVAVGRLPGHAWRACEPGAAEGGAAAAPPPAPAAPPALLFSAAAWTSWVLSGCDAADVGLADDEADAAGGAPSELVDHDGGAGCLHRPRLLICWAVAASLLLVATLVLGCRELRADKRFCATFLILFLSVTQLVSTLLFLAILPSPPPADLLASSGDAADPAGPFFAAAAAFSLLAVIVAAAWIATLVCRGDLLEARASLETSWTFELALLLATLGSAEVLHSLPWSRRGGGLALPIELLRLGPLWAIQAIYAYLVVAPAVGDPLTLNGALAALDRITIGAAPTPTVLALVCAAVTTLSLLTALFRGVLRCCLACRRRRSGKRGGPDRGRGTGATEVEVEVDPMRASRPDPAPPPSSDAEWAGMTPAAAAAAHFEAYDAYDVPSADDGSTARSRGSCAGREASEMQERAQRVSSRLPPHLAARIADAQSRYDCASGAAPRSGSPVVAPPPVSTASTVGAAAAPDLASPGYDASTIDALGSWSDAHGAGAARHRAAGDAGGAAARRPPRRLAAAGGLAGVAAASAAANRRGSLDEYVEGGGGSKASLPKYASMMASTNELSVGASRCSCMSSASRAPSTARLSVGGGAAGGFAARAAQLLGEGSEGYQLAERCEVLKRQCKEAKDAGSPKYKELKRSYHEARKALEREVREEVAALDEAEAAGQWNGEMAMKRSELTALVQAQGSAAAEESSRILLGAASRGNAFASTSSMCSSVAAPRSGSLPAPAPPPRPGGEQEV